MGDRGRLRFVFYGILVGSILGFGAGCAYASFDINRRTEKARETDPTAHICGMVWLAEFTMGVLGVIPGGLVGAGIGTICLTWPRVNSTNERAA